MLKGNKIMWLLAVLLLLVGVFLVVKFTGNSGRSKSFRSELVTIDKDAVTKVVLTTPTDTTILEKSGEEWTVDGNKHAETNTVKSMLSHLEQIKPSRLASRSEETWKDFMVDDAGTRVVVYEGSDKTLDIILGRFNVEGQHSFYSYVRLAEEPDVYVAKDFMKMGVGTRSADYRNDGILQFHKDSISRIDFNYPDSGFVLKNTAQGWMLDGNRADSLAVAKYLQSVKFTNSKNFVDKNPSQSPQYEIVFTKKENQAITISVYDDGVIGSSSNTEEYWKDPALKEKFSIGKAGFSAQ